MVINPLILDSVPENMLNGDGSRGFTFIGQTIKSFLLIKMKLVTKNSNNLLMTGGYENSNTGKKNYIYESLRLGASKKLMIDSTGTSKDWDSILMERENY